MLSRFFIIEVSQFIINMVSHFPNRVVDIDDVILNGTGALVAAIICFGFMKTKLYQLQLAEKLGIECLNFALT